ncbi:myosin-2 heavy chain-like [Scyliorhinus canicula]|uniref:myosin-2 heavy chain-like n=1 Tax=Scyliorhinus canicula TaxID=7830 RepID=UPI0018F2848C|nr:myosin-2 heavy chain-like [Scyliorhinus canicula]XP_038638174.1 myosin-2 heavy chain-like [Scyliorhinus canicula]XP_038638175.1 myosin-2 heavy chain-like [Scyliorhinus canicula]XP_038638176.1 myosin-2 heavy chain-like [Scyliorhinus canicula]
METDTSMEQIEEQKQEQIEEEKSEQIEEQKQEQIEEQKPEQTEEQKSEQFEEQNPEQIEEQIEGQIEEQNPEQIEEQNLEPIEEQKPEQIEEQKPEHIEEQNPEQIEEQKPEQIEEQKPEQIEEQELEQIEEQKSEQIEEQIEGQIEEQIEEQIPEQIEEQKPEQIEEQKLEQIEEQKPKQIEEQIAVQIEEQIEEQKPEQIEEQKLEQIEEQKPEQIEEQKPEQIEEQKPEQIEEQKPEQIEEQKLEQIEEQNPEQIEEQKPEQIEEQKLEQIEEQKPEQIEEQKPEQIEEQKLEQIEEQKPEQIEEQKPEQIEDQKQEQIEEQKPEQTEEQIEEQEPQQIEKQKPEQIEEQKPEQVEEQKSEQFEEQKPEQIEEQNLEQIEEQKPEQIEEQKPWHQIRIQSLVKVDDFMPDIGVFSTALSEEQLEAATEKARQNIFGSSGIFHLQSFVGKSYVFSAIINNRAEERCKDGRRLLNMGKLEEAVISFSKAIALNPRMKEFYFKRAEAYLHMGDFQSAIVNYRMASSLDPSDEDILSQIAYTLYIQGQCLFEMKLYTKALLVFVQASEMRPENQHYHMRSVETLIALGRLEDSLKLVNNQLENVKSNAELYILRARLHYHFFQIANCYRDVSSALALDPTNQEALTLLVTLVNRAEEAKAQAVNKSLLGKLNSALDNINEAIDNNPNQADYYVFRGTLHRRLKNFNAAIDDYLFVLDRIGNAEQSDTYVETQSQLLLTYNDFAVHCYHKGFIEEAIILLNLSIRGEKQQKGLYVNRGDCFLKLCNLDFALLDYEQALELDPEDWRIQIRIAAIKNEKGLLEHQNGNYQQAETYFTNAIENNPHVSQYYLHRAKTRAILQHVTGSQEDAIMSLLLDIRNKAVIPLLTHLFPGKSRDEILASKVVESVRAKLSGSLHSCPTHDTKMLQDRPALPTPPKHPASEIVGRKRGVQKAESDFASCIKETGQYEELAERKKMLTQEIQKSLHYRKPLLIDSPDIRMILKPPPASETASPNKPCKWKGSRSLFTGGN